MQTLTLKPHPDVVASAPKATLTALIDFDHSKLRVQFFFASETGLLVQRPTSSSGIRRDELWKQTCFEVFFGFRGEPGYWEVNVSPSGDWNVYAFNSYRSGMTPETRVKSLVGHHFQMKAGGLECHFEIDLAPLSIHGKIDVGATAVIETEAGEKSYWAVTHAGEKPDFHLRNSFSHKVDLD